MAWRRSWYLHPGDASFGASGRRGARRDVPISRPESAETDCFPISPAHLTLPTPGTPRRADFPWPKPAEPGLFPGAGRLSEEQAIDERGHTEPGGDIDGGSCDHKTTSDIGQCRVPRLERPGRDDQHDGREQTGKPTGQAIARDGWRAPQMAEGRVVACVERMRGKDRTQRSERHQSPEDHR